MYSDFGFYGGFTQLFPILFGVIFLIVAVMIVVTDSGDLAVEFQ